MFVFRKPFFIIAPDLLSFVIYSQVSMKTSLCWLVGSSPELILINIICVDSSG